VLKKHPFQLPQNFVILTKGLKTSQKGLKLKFHTCNFMQAFYSLHKLYIAWPWQHKDTFIRGFISVSGCQTCMCNRSMILATNLKAI